LSACPAGYGTATRAIPANRRRSFRAVAARAFSLRVIAGTGDRAQIGSLSSASRRTGSRIRSTGPAAEASGSLGGCSAQFPCTGGWCVAVRSPSTASAGDDIPPEHQALAIAHHNRDTRLTSIQWGTAQNDEPFKHSRLVDSVRLNRRIANNCRTVSIRRLIEDATPEDTDAIGDIDWLGRVVNTVTNQNAAAFPAAICNSLLNRLAGRSRALAATSDVIALRRDIDELLKM
jgi:hypothetical protein